MGFSDKLLSPTLILIALVAIVLTGAIQNDFGGDSHGAN